MDFYHGKFSREKKNKKEKSTSLTVQEINKKNIACTQTFLKSIYILMKYIIIPLHNHTKPPLYRA